MKLLRAEIRNYRSIKSVDIRFDPSCRVLVGINESGKSNILKALALLDPSRAPSLDDIRMEGNEEAPPTETFVRFVFALSPQEQDELFKSACESFLPADLNVPLVRAAADESWLLTDFCKYRSERLYRVELTDGSRTHVAWSARSGWQIMPGWLRTKGQTALKHASWTEAISVPAGTWFYKEHFEISAGEEPDTPDIAALNTLISRLGKPISERELPKCIYWEYREADLIPRTIPIDGFCANPDSCVPLANMFALADIPKANIQGSISAARERAPAVYQRLLEKVGIRATQYLRKVWKDHAKVSIELLPNGTNIEPIVRDIDLPLGFASRSDGFKRMINFLLHISVAVTKDSIENTLILIDEPEIGLHPKGARNLAAELFDLGARNSIVFSTHSIFMVDRERIDRHVIVKKVKEVTVTEDAGKALVLDEEVLYQALGWSFLDVLQANNVVFEGWRDKQLFLAYLQPAERRLAAIDATNGKIGITHASGAKDISHVCRQLELAQRKCLVMSDSDKPSLEAKARHEADHTYGDWKTYADVFSDKQFETGEDFLTEAALTGRCKTFAVASGLPELTNDALVRPRWLKLKAWISNGSSGDQNAKQLEDQMKSAMFERLTRKEVDSQYETVKQYVIDHFEDKGESAE